MLSMLIGFLVFVFFLSFPDPVLGQGATLSSLSHEDMLEAKQLGYSDIQISQRMGTTEDEVRTKMGHTGFLLFSIDYVLPQKLHLRGVSAYVYENR